MITTRINISEGIRKVQISRGVPRKNLSALGRARLPLQVDTMPTACQPQLASHTNIFPIICIHCSLLAFWSQDTDANATTARVPLNVSEMAILLSLLVVHCKHCAYPHFPFLQRHRRTPAKRNMSAKVCEHNLCCCLFLVALLPYISYRLKLVLAAWNVTGKGLARSRHNL